MLPKKDMRRQQFNKLEQISHEWDKSRNELLIYQHLFASQIWKQAETVGITISNPQELDTKPLIAQALSFGKVVCVPKTFSGRKMKFFQLTAHTKIIKSKFGVFEPQNEYGFVSPAKIDLLVVPGLAFSANGDRLGFGGGFYDRFLTNYCGQIISCAGPERFYATTKWETEPTDQKIPNILTIEGWCSASQKGAQKNEHA